MFQISLLIFLGTQTWMERTLPLPEPMERRLRHAEATIREEALLRLRCRRNVHEQQALWRGLGDALASVRWRAFAGLLLCDEKQMMEAMFRASRDEAYLIRLAVARRAARVRGRDSFLLLRSLLEDRHPVVYAYALVGLVQRGYALASPMLRRRLRQQEQEVVQEALLLAIERMRADRAVSVLWDVLRHRDTALRGLALRVLVSLSLSRRDVRRKALRWLMREQGRLRGDARGPMVAALAILGEPNGLRAYRLLLKEGPLGPAKAGLAFLSTLEEPIAVEMLREAAKTAMMPLRLEAETSWQRMQGEMQRWRSAEERSF